MRYMIGAIFGHCNRLVDKDTLFILHTYQMGNHGRLKKKVRLDGITVLEI